jgi:hypothetical protein
VAVPSVIGLWAFVVPLWRAYRMRAGAGSAPRATGEPGVALRREGLENASPARRVTEARGRLEEARLTILTAQSLLDDAGRGSWWDILGLSFDRGRAKQGSFGAAVRHLRNAEQLATTAFELLHVEHATEALELDCSPVLFEMDTAWLTDGTIPAVAVHLRIEKARRRAARLLATIESAFGVLGPSDGA